MTRFIPVGADHSKSKIPPKSGILVQYRSERIVSLMRKSFRHIGIVLTKNDWEISLTCIKLSDHIK